MIIILTFAVFVLIGALVGRLRESVCGWMVMAVGVLGLVICLISVPIQRLEIRAELAAFEAVRATVEEAREDGADPLELAAFQMKVAESNEWLAGMQYWRDSIFRLWYPPELDETKPIR